VYIRRRALMADIFLSYSQQERAVAQTIVPLLTGEGWTVWWDADGLSGGDLFRTVIERELSAAHCVLVLWSRVANARAFVLDEAETGRRRGVLVQAIIDDVAEPPIGFRQVHWIRVSSSGGKLEPAHPLIESVRKKLTVARNAPSKPIEPTSPELRRPLKSRVTWFARFLAVGIVVVIAMLLLGKPWAADKLQAPKPGRIAVTTTPKGATISIDGQQVASETPAVIARPPGTYKIAIAASGFLNEEQQVEVTSGSTITVDFTLRATVPPEEAQETGFSLSSDPSGEVIWLDGKTMPGPSGPLRTDARARRIPPGRHVLTVSDERFKPWNTVIDVVPGIVRAVHADLEPILIPSSECSITIRSSPPAEIWVDGAQAIKRAPLEDYKVLCGTHRIGFKRAKPHIDDTEIITVSPGETFKRTFQLVTE
jgi:hypothetical protein